MHAEQYIDRLTLPDCSLDRLSWLDRQRIGRNDSQTYSIRSRGSRAEIKHRGADLERIAIDHGFLANRHEWRRVRHYRDGGGREAPRILPARKGKANGSAWF